MLNLNCQVCGNPMYSQSYCGTKSDGSTTNEYCSNCYKGGQFYSQHHMDGGLVGAASSWPFLYTGRGVGM